MTREKYKSQLEKFGSGEAHTKAQYRLVKILMDCGWEVPAKGITIDKDGYVQIKDWSHRFHDHQGYVRQHRIIWEKHHNACLLPWAHVHHKNKIPWDNRIENLEAMMEGEHHRRHSKKDMTGRKCALCEGQTHIDKKGWPRWHKYADGTFICAGCYMRHFFKKNARKV